ncbi:hypothetical protein [Leptospira kmetyi]|nr:hypothetical protein [Leptospira kmetyi]
MFTGVDAINSEECVKDYIFTNLSGHKRNRTSIEFGLGLRIISIDDNLDIFKANDVILKVDQCVWREYAEHDQFYKFDTTINYLGFANNPEVKSILLIRDRKLYEFRKGFFGGIEQKEISKPEIIQMDNDKKNRRYNNRTFLVKDYSEEIALVVMEYRNALYIRELSDNSFRIVTNVEFLEVDGNLIIRFEGRNLYKLLDKKLVVQLDELEYKKFKNNYRVRKRNIFQIPQSSN